ncbi:hypothetical protein PHYPSEUDO_012967 [Phytophthora pseudosyringae]|uniref:Uncharacterized protein n=1 Tax=Phytophthora pseudosyringae TaxID=221518 RepID=A0A8T1W468_9STRA|nr:hypothetical protein PHYPSEUDO_012967 [Phytophthora pseudosyringae]
MADLIEKIGRFFADQEAQIQESFTQIATRASLPSSKPPPPVHRIPSHLSAHASPVQNPVPNPPRSNSILRRRLSFKSAVEPTATTQAQSWQEGINEILDAVQPQSKLREVSTLKSCVPLPPSRPSLPAEDIWHHRLSGDLDSWRSSSSLASTVNSRDCSTKDDLDLVSQTGSDAPERQRKPRPPQQKHRKRSRKKKRSNNQEEDRSDPKEAAKANAEKVAAALTLAQERAKRIQQVKLQLERDQELERQETAVRLQEQMIKIEAVRARSFRTARSSLSSNESDGHSHDLESVRTADTNDLVESQQQASQVMTELEAQLREKMSLEMHVKQSCLEKHKQRERVRLKLDKLCQQNAVQSSKVARLSAVKASLEMELAAVLEDTAHTRQQRRELERADERARLKRQREAERALQIRLREEEWNSMMEEEKARAQVAAEARAKASKRVEAHSAKLRKMMQAYRYEPRHSSSTGASSGGRSNNENESDTSDDESNASSTSTDKPAQPFTMNFLLPPELADFEEDGLCNNSERLQAATQHDGEPTVLDNNEKHTEPAAAAFRWQVPSFPDPTQFTQVLVDMVSDDEDE